MGKWRPQADIRCSVEGERRPQVPGRSDRVLFRRVLRRISFKYSNRLSGRSIAFLGSTRKKAASGFGGRRRAQGKPAEPPKLANDVAQQKMGGPCCNQYSINCQGSNCEGVRVSRTAAPTTRSLSVAFSLDLALPNIRDTIGRYL